MSNQKLRVNEKLFERRLGRSPDKAGNQSSFLEGYLIWNFIIGIFVIPVSMAVTTLGKAQQMTGWTRGYSMILGAIIGIILTLIAAALLERKSR